MGGNHNSFASAAEYEEYKRRTRRQAQKDAQSYPDSYYASLPEAAYLYEYPIKSPSNAVSTKEWSEMVYAEGRRRGLDRDTRRNPRPRKAPGKVYVKGYYRRKPGGR